MENGKYFWNDFFALDLKLTIFSGKMNRDACCDNQGLQFPRAWKQIRRNEIGY